MADILLTLNGIGRGHLTRGLCIFAWLRRNGRRPLVIHQGTYPQDFALRYPGVSAPALYEEAPRDRLGIAAEIISIARRSRPSVIIEDTYPAPVTFPEDVCRILVVRPTVIEHMRQLNQDHGATYQNFMICDDPESPTWPFSHDETQEILGWAKFSTIGPVYRRPGMHRIVDIRNRYRIHPGDHVVVFSLGGGGEQHGSNDRLHFISEAETIAKSYRNLHSDARFLFVCGPLFPQSQSIPTLFERIQEEPELPSLFANATGAVIRFGYNSLWECIAAGTPFLPVLGVGYMEPFDLRLDAMRRFGLPVPRTVEELADDDLRDSFKSNCALVTARFPGSPSKGFIEILSAVAPTEMRDTIDNSDLGFPSQRIKHERYVVGSHNAQCLCVRVDGVTHIDVGLYWFMDLLRDLDIYASLEIIPYVSRLQRKHIERLDSDGRCEVSMHGFCGITQNIRACDSAEFTECSGGELNIQKARLKLGFRLMRYIYRERFQGGLSFPVLTIPEWIPSFWSTIGGRHVSRQADFSSSLTSEFISIVCTQVEKSFRPVAEVLDEMEILFERDGCAGLMFSSWALSSEEGRKFVERILRKALASRASICGCPLSKVREFSAHL